MMRRHNKNAGDMFNPIYGYDQNGKERKLTPLGDYQPSLGEQLCALALYVGCVTLTLVVTFKIPSFTISLMWEAIGLLVTICLEERCKQLGIESVIMTCVTWMFGALFVFLFIRFGMLFWGHWDMSQDKVLQLPRLKHP